MKVFFIGASKMGTTSITNALKEQGVRVTHTPHFGVYSHLTEPNEAFFSKFDYFLDGNFHNFHHLKTWFPDARFVLLDRNPHNWLLSLFNWLSHIDERHMADEKLLVKISRLIMGKLVYQRIMTDWAVYRKRALHFFQHDKHFIHIDIEANGEQDWKKLSDHLGIDLAPQWENQQKKQSFPEWLPKIVDKASVEAKTKSKEYPALSPTSFRDRAFLYTMKVLSRDFIRERHLAKNLKEVWAAYPPSHAMRYRKSAGHLARFVRVIGCLGLRIATTRDRRLSPFIY